MQRIRYNRVSCDSALFALLLALCLIGSAEANQAAYEAGVNALSIGDRVTAAAQFRKAAETGHLQAQYYLGLLSAGNDVNSGDNVEALKWMRMSAEQGYPPAQQTLGTWYFAGGSAPYNPAEASLWFRKAADQHDDTAMFFLGVMHARGEGVSKDYKIALGWFQMAEAKGYPVPAEYLTTEGIATLDREYQSAQAAAAQPAVKSRPATVRNVQDGLTQLGYKPGPVDGMMGKKTANAIKAFQRDTALPVDGKVSEELMRRIDGKLGQ